MMNPLIASLVFQSEMVIAFIFYSNIADRRFASVKVLLGGFFLFECGAIINLCGGNSIPVNILVSIIIHFVFSKVFFQINFRNSIFFSIVLVALSFALEIVLISVVSAFTNSQPLDYNNDFFLFILECPISKIIYFIATLFLSKAIKPYNRPCSLPFSILLFPIITLISLIVFFYVCAIDRISPEGQYLVAVCSMALFIATILLVLTYQLQAEKDSNYMQMQNEFKRLQMEKSYYDILEYQNQQLLIYAHDAKNHLAAIENLNSNPDINGYVKKLSERLDSYTRNCHSGNKFLDVIINKYVTECEYRGIDFKYNVKLCNLKNIDELDLVAILGNLMDNALTAAEESCEKKISLETSIRNLYSVIVIQNSSDTPPKEDGMYLKSSKKDQSSHGIGLKSVAMTLKMYQGDLQWDYDESRKLFTMTVMIGNPLNEKATT